MRAERCEACKYFESDGVAENGAHVGTCCRYPPTMLVDPDKDEVDYFYVSVGAYGWCGEWKQQEPKP